MRVANVDGLVTLFYDGSKELWNEELEMEWSRKYRNHSCNEEVWESWDLSDECKRYWKERQSWQQIIVVEGVTEIPEKTFSCCFNVKRVIFANTVIRIRGCAFIGCKNLVFIKWSHRLEFIGTGAFGRCNLSSVFIPHRCREIKAWAFACNKNLSILNVPQDTQLGRNVIKGNKLLERYLHNGQEDINSWLKNMNNDEKFALHRACASFNPLKEVIHAIILQNGPRAFQVENSAGITPSQYLKENPYTDLSEKEIIHDYLNKMMGAVE